MSRPAFAVNGRFFGQRTTGVQRYAREVVAAMGRGEAGRRGVVLTPPGATVPAGIGLAHRAIGPGTGHLWEQTVLPARWRGPLVNLCNTAPVSLGDQVVCMHDANVFERPDSYSRGFRATYATLLPLLARRARRIATVSRDSALQLARHLPLRASDVAILPNGHEHALLWDPSRSKLPADAVPTRPYVLAIGSRARHKNMALLGEIAPSLDDLGLDLVIAGGGASIFADEAEGPWAGNVRHLGTMSDDDLALLMDRAFCLAFPSLTEGFGLPIVEAMARGCPVVSSDRASMPEVCGEAALMASPTDAQAWVNHMRTLVVSGSLREDLIGRGREQVTRFSWTKTAEGYLDMLAAGSTATTGVARPDRDGAAPLPTAAVVVATRGRPEVVSATLSHLLATQTVTPLEVVVSCADARDAGTTGDLPGVRVIEARPGLAAQRNDGLAALTSDPDVVVFFDDDFVADPDWMAATLARFAAAPDVVAITGTVLADDVKGPGLSFEAALAIVGRGEAAPGPAVIEGYSPYGCNMAFRRSAIGDLRFDERLVLYGWLEDRDFAAALRRQSKGRLVKIRDALGVHMGAKGGRVPGRRLGYSQVVNPIYMHRKGTMAVGNVADHLFRNVMSNVRGAVRPEPHIDRVGRLVGNAMGFLDLARGRVRPERAANL